MPNNSKQVQTTKDYAMFTSVNGNRTLNQLHLARLKDSIKRKYLFTTIIVNERFEIIDGQHRFTACKDLGLPINYIVVPGYGLEEVQILNASAKTWSWADYLSGYCKLGYPEYLRFKEFADKYKFTHQVNLDLLSKIDGHSGRAFVSFKEGTFEIGNYEFAESVARKIKAIKAIYPGAERVSFVVALMNCLRKPRFSFDEFMGKLRLKSTMLVDCTTTTSYMALIEEIYNYKRKEKVNLRF